VILEFLESIKNSDTRRIDKTTIKFRVMELVDIYKSCIKSYKVV